MNSLAYSMSGLWRIQQLLRFPESRLKALGTHECASTAAVVWQGRGVKV